MIFDHNQNIGNYSFLNAPVVRALEIIRNTDFAALEDGTYEVEGRELFYFLQSYETKPVNDTPEAHRKYIDIQYILSGKEKMGVGQLDTMTEEVEARPDGDIWFYHGPMDEVNLTAGMFTVFFPNDAHAPGMSPAEGANAVRKCVFKVRV